MELDPQTSASVDLVRDAQNGDSRALGRLYERYLGRVHRIVRLRLNTPQLRRKYDSMDIAQETFVLAIRHFDRFEVRHESALINWLAKIAENSIRSRQRRRSTWEQDPRAAAESSFTTVEPESPIEIPIELCAKNEEQAILEECVRELPEQYREVIILRDFSKPPGLAKHVPWEVVAEEIGSPSSEAARMLHARARAELAELVQRRIRD